MNIKFSKKGNMSPTSRMMSIQEQDAEVVNIMKNSEKSDIKQTIGMIEDLMSRQELAEIISDDFLFGEHINIEAKDLKDILKMHKQCSHTAMN
jgi:hypothetical protein